MRRLINISEEQWKKAEKIGEALPVKANRQQVLRSAIQEGLETLEKKQKKALT